MRRCSHHHDSDSVSSFRGYRREPNDSDTRCFVNVALEKFLTTTDSSLHLPRCQSQIDICKSSPDRRNQFAEFICQIDHLCGVRPEYLSPNANAKDERCALFLDSRGSEMPATCLNWKAVLHCEHFSKARKQLEFAWPKPAVHDSTLPAKTTAQATLDDAPTIAGNTT